MRTCIFAAVVSSGSAQRQFDNPCMGLDEFEVWGKDECIQCIEPEQNDWFEKLELWNTDVAIGSTNMTLTECLREEQYFTTFHDHLIQNCGAATGKKSFVCTYPYFDVCNLETGAGCPPIIFPTHFNCVSAYAESRHFAEWLKSLCPGNSPAALEL